MKTKGKDDKIDVCIRCCQQLQLHANAVNNFFSTSFEQ